MEGVGSRLGRASSRYGGGSGSAPVFNGPVRKWKKQWVCSSQPNNSSLRGNVAGPKLMLCRWTPLSSSSTTTTTTSPPQTHKRKFRYAPIVDLEERKKEKEALDNEAKTRKLNQSITSATSSNNILKKQNINDIFDDDFEELRTDQSICSESNFDLCLEGCD